MKITQGHTLSQFVDLLNEDVCLAFAKSQLAEPNGPYQAMTWGYKVITRYSNFLKQPLTKEMLVNSSTHPDAMPVKWSCKKGNPFYEDHLNNWQEAEKKVIFDGWKFESLNEDIREWIVTHESGIFIVKNRGKDTFMIRGIKGFSRIGIRTLHDLFEATNGSLKLKNVEV